MTRLFNKKDHTQLRRALRKELPPAEIILWTHLKGKQLGGKKFRRQYGVGNYILDFYCPELKLGIEIDGDSHFNKTASNYGELRNRYLSALGIKIIRFTNLEIYHDMENVLEKLNRFIN